LNWKEEAFVVPDPIKTNWEQTWEKSSSEYENWQKNYKASSHYSELKRIQAKKLPENWDSHVNELLEKVLKEKPGHASRMSS